MKITKEMLKRIDFALSCIENTDDTEYNKLTVETRKAIQELLKYYGWN